MNENKNEFIDCGDYYEVVIYNKNKIERARALIDKKEKTKIEVFRWFLLAGYAATSVNGKSLLMHHMIFGRKKDLQIDHIDRNRLNNRKDNLRFATHTQNIQNSYTKGYSWDKGNQKWRVQIYSNKKIVCSKRFLTEQEAKEAVKQAKIKYHGEFACLD